MKNKAIEKGKKRGNKKSRGEEGRREKMRK